MPKAQAFPFVVHRCTCGGNCMAELEAEVERLRAVCDSQNRLIEVTAASKESDG